MESSPAISPRSSSRVYLWLALPLLLAAAGGALVLYLFNPAQSAFYPFCVFHRTTGLLCPGCGSLRALHQLLHGHLLTALRYNALLVLTLPFLLWAAAHQLSCYFRHVRSRIVIRPAWVWTGLAVLVIYAVLRNLPFSQLAFLGP